MRFTLICLFIILGYISCTKPSSSEPLSLNQGEKWQVNPEMKVHIQAQVDQLDAYISNHKTDYKDLANSLKSENKQLIKSCTMDGPAHDELHKWLAPHLDRVGTLSKTTDPKEADQLIQEIQTSFGTYQKYFE